MTTREKRPSSALLIIDMISCWDFPDAEALLPHAAAVAGPLSSLKQHFRDVGLPIIYCNDNRGRWRSDFRTLVDDSLDCGGKGAEITRLLLPSPDDYFVLKPMQSAFFETPLGSLLKHLKVDQLVLAGVSSDQCIMASAMEAGMRGFAVVIAAQAVATQTAHRNDAALRQFEETHKLEVLSVAQIYGHLKPDPDDPGRHEENAA